MQKPTQVVGRRAAAFVIDVLIWAAIIVVSWYALTKNVSQGGCIGGGIEINNKCRAFVASEKSHRTIWLIIIGLVPILLFIVMQGLTGKTPGKAVLGIKVVKGDGSPPGLLRTLGRELMWIVDFWIVALIAALASQNNQRLGDMVAGTYVVDKNFAGAIPTAAQPAAVSAGGGGYGPPPSGAPAATAPPPEQQGDWPADWYPDPQGQARLRYWDGQRWTEHTSA
jgi:uncharacterized RDD family membrane protein YckC